MRDVLETGIGIKIRSGLGLINMTNWAKIDRRGQFRKEVSRDSKS